MGINLGGRENGTEKIMLVQHVTTPAQESSQPPGCRPGSPPRFCTESKTELEINYWQCYPYLRCNPKPTPTPSPWKKLSPWQSWCKKSWGPTPVSPSWKTNFPHVWLQPVILAAQQLIAEWRLVILTMTSYRTKSS